MIYSLTGEEVMNVNLTKNELDVSELTSGVYFVKTISVNNEINTQKMVIQ